MSLQRIAILASGTGTNALAIIKAAQSGKLQAEISLVLSNRPNAKVLEKATACNVPTLCIDHTEFTTRQAFEQAVCAALMEYKTDIVAMAGYMRLVTQEFLEAFPRKVLNMHPALLPSFTGAHALNDARAYGVKMTGCTVHFVSEVMDMGAIIIQGATPVMEEDLEAISARVHAMEHRLFPQALEWLVAGRLQVQGERIVTLKTNAHAKPAPLCPFPHLIWPPLENPF